MGANQCWTSLEKLFLSHNLIAEISSNIAQLTQLTNLDLSHNYIHILPHTDTWNCNRLVKLNLSHNKLVAISYQDRSNSLSSANAPGPTQNKDSVTQRLRHIWSRRPNPQLATAAQLTTTSLAPVDDVSRDLPYEMWSGSLHSLYLNSNNLECIPEKVGNLSALTRLDLSEWVLASI